MKSQKTKERILTLIGVYFCLTLLLPLGYYKIEPPTGHVGTFWGFLNASTYLIFIIGILVIFRTQIQKHINLSADIIVILSGIIIITTGFLGGFFYPITQTLIERFHQIINQTGNITYLDVETGGLFFYLLFGVGFFCIILGITNYNYNGLNPTNSEK